MIKGWMRDLTLSVQAKSGISTAFFVWVAILAVASLMVFVFVCVTAYVWLADLYGNTVAGVIVTAFFLVIALISAIGLSVARRRTIERAILARAARAHTPAWWLDPRILSVGLQAGRSLGWQRIVPIALLGFMAVQWAREHRGHSQQDTA